MYFFYVKYVMLHTLSILVSILIEIYEIVLDSIIRYNVNGRLLEIRGSICNRRISNAVFILSECA